MSRMAAIIQTTRGGRCGICVTDFEPGEIGYTHIGGERHDGFHKDCYANWLRNHTICPYNDAKVDPSLLVSRMTRIMVRLKPALESAAIAAGIGLAVAAPGAITVTKELVGRTISLPLSIAATVIVGDSLDPEIRLICGAVYVVVLSLKIIALFKLGRFEELSGRTGMNE